MTDEELETCRRQATALIHYEGYLDDKSSDEYARDGARTVLRLLDEIDRRKSAEWQERERILRWLRVAYQWVGSYRALADAIERRDYERPYSPPPGLVNERPAMTAEEYDAKRAKELEFMAKYPPADEMTSTEWREAFSGSGRLLGGKDG